MAWNLIAHKQVLSVCTITLYRLSHWKEAENNVAHLADEADGFGFIAAAHSNGRRNACAMSAFLDKLVSPDYNSRASMKYKLRNAYKYDKV